MTWFLADASGRERLQALRPSRNSFSSEESSLPGMVAGLKRSKKHFRASRSGGFKRGGLTGSTVSSSLSLGVRASQSRPRRLKSPSSGCSGKTGRRRVANQSEGFGDFWSGTRKWRRSARDGLSDASGSSRRRLGQGNEKLPQRALPRVIQLAVELTHRRR